MEKQLNMHFSDKLVIRTPALPFTRVSGDAAIETLLKDRHFMEAIELASPVLYKECMKRISGSLTDEKEIQRINNSLAKYYQRMYSRCTPFGLFSGCAVVNWEEETNVSITPLSFRRSTRLDMHYLCALALHLSSIPVLRNRLLFYPNNSCYKAADGLRYVEYNYENKARMYKISAVDATEWIDMIFEKAKQGTTIDAIADLLQQNDISAAEAAEFTNDLINNQLLISELDPKITGDEYMHQLLQVLQKVNKPAAAEITTVTSLLEDIVQELRNCDEAGYDNHSRYAALIEKVKQTGVPFEEGRLLQTDRFPVPARAGVSRALQAKLLNLVKTLMPLSVVAAETNLTTFAENFRSRYEDKELPLLQVLDTETGIGYTRESGKNLSPLIQDLVMPPGERNNYEIKWNPKEQWLFDLLLRSQHEYEIELPVDTIPQAQELQPLPPSVSVMFSLVENGKIMFRGASGSSAVNILGRFGYGDEAIRHLCKQVADEEQAANPSIVFAEIIHLPEDRVGNILQHPPFRKYEIPFLASSSVAPEYQVPLQDILISVRNNRIRLRSLSLNKQIIPRLSNAHNFSFRSLPVYQLLADLQAQGFVNSVSFSWGAMARHFRFLPRVKTGDVILSEATWQLKKEDFSDLITTSNKEAVQSFTKKWRMPALIVLADGDNELLVDWNSELSVRAFISSIRNREQIVLKEFLLPDVNGVNSADGKPYCNQFVAALVNGGETIVASLPAAHVKKKNYTGGFLPGTEWVYYKIYCGSKSADDILAHMIHPLVNELRQKGIIDKWFFIRYVDPDFHIRLRFHLPDISRYGEVVAACIQYFQPALDKGVLWKIQADTYFREMERYGDDKIAIAEDLFCYDSELKLEFLQLTDGDERETLRWQWGMRGVDELMDAMGYSLDRKYRMMQFFRDAFAAEFNADKNLYKQLNTRYNENRALVQMAMEQPVSAGNTLKPLLDLYSATRMQLHSIVQRLQVSSVSERDQQDMEGWTGSYIHMNLNRLFLSEPRLHEMVLYDFLCSWYRSQLSRKAKNAT